MQVFQRLYVWVRDKEWDVLASLYSYEAISHRERRGSLMLEIDMVGSNVTPRYQKEKCIHQVFSLSMSQKEDSEMQPSYILLWPIVANRAY